MRRFLRLAFNGAGLLSLVAFLVTGWLWWHSYGSHNDRVNLYQGVAPFALRSEAGRLSILGLPHEDALRGAKIRRFVARYGNADLSWYMFRDGGTFPWRPGARGPWDFLPELEDRGMGWSGDRSNHEIYRSLFASLADPRRFALAHVLLTCAVDPSQWPRDGTPGRFDFGIRHVEASLGELRMELPPGGAGWSRDPFSPQGGGDPEYGGPAARYYPAQIPKLRDFWFSRLAVPVCSVPWWVAVFASALPASLWLALQARLLLILRHRRLKGMCRRCGYDLTGNTSGECSECGAPVGSPARPS
jgi:hypothetical protein